MNKSNEIHFLLERLSTLFRASFRQAATENGLKLVQLEALTYFAHANRYSDTAAGLTAYLGATKGTVSQTIKALEKHGLIEKIADADDRRVAHCRPTESGYQVIEGSVPAELVGKLSAGQKSTVLNQARELLRTLQHANAYKAFGQCRNCKHHLNEGGQLRCGLTNEDLSESESTKICREFE